MEHHQHWSFEGAVEAIDIDKIAVGFAVWRGVPSLSLVGQCRCSAKHRRIDRLRMRAEGTIAQPPWRVICRCDTQIIRGHSLLPRCVDFDALPTISHHRANLFERSGRITCSRRKARKSKSARRGERERAAAFEF